MASFYSSSTLVCLTLVLLFCVQCTLGGITCESLDRSTCAFAVSSSGLRCVLENRLRRGGQEEFSCRTSDIEAENLKDWVETDECIKACGLARSTVGISSDSLLEPQFAQKLCSPQCYQECPNVVDLYFNLAAGEGVFLPKLCQASTNARRGMAEIKSSGAAAAGPASGSAAVAWAPGQSEIGSVSGEAMAPC
ncbi:PAR-1b protein [Cocos nucifera]|nr:PAR-1b protein [Cocos nucifera]